MRFSIFTKSKSSSKSTTSTLSPPPSSMEFSPSVISTPRSSSGSFTSTSTSTSTTRSHSPAILSEEDIPLSQHIQFVRRAHKLDQGPIDEEDRQLGHKHNMFLIPLDLAARMDVIKYRPEGFEMQEHRNHVLEVCGRRPRRF